MLGSGVGLRVGSARFGHAGVGEAVVVGVGVGPHAGGGGGCSATGNAEAMGMGIKTTGAGLGVEAAPFHSKPLPIRSILFWALIR